jgi:hypothetical protein
VYAKLWSSVYFFKLSSYLSFYNLVYIFFFQNFLERQIKIKSNLYV